MHIVGNYLAKGILPPAQWRVNVAKG